MFSYNSKFYQTVSQILDCIVLSFLWIVSSLPIITIGASTTALYYAVDKVIRREEGNVYFQGIQPGFVYEGLTVRLF